MLTAVYYTNNFQSKCIFFFHFSLFRPKKIHATKPSNTKGLLSGDDPYLIDSAITQKLFPQLSLESSTRPGGNSSLQLITLREGDKSVTLPSLSIEQNYSQMLSELVMNIWTKRNFVSLLLQKSCTHSYVITS